MESFLTIMMGALLWDIIKRIHRAYRRSKYPGLRVYFEATVSSMDEAQHLFKHILKVPPPENGAFVMYDINYKVWK